MEKVERKIAKLEKEVQELNKKLENSEIANDPDKLAKICNEVALIETKITEGYILWEELSE